MKTKLLLVFALFVFQYSFSNAVADPVAPTVSPRTYCDPNNDGFGTFDFADLNYQILGAQSGAASNYAVAYYENLPDAQAGTNSISNPYNNSSPNSQTIYFRVTDINTNAYAVGSFQVVVNPTPIASFPPDVFLCDYDNNGVETFNLSSLIPMILGSTNPSTASVSFYASLLDANLGSSPIIPISNFSAPDGTVLWARLALNATGCYDLVSFQLHVVPLPQSLQPNYPQYALCDSTGLPGYETFDLGSRVNSILLGQTGVDVTFYPSLGDAQNGANPITNLLYTNTTQYAQTLGIRLTNYATGCYTISTMDIRVVPLPQLTPTTPYVVCDNNQDGTAAFDLTALIPSLQVSVLDTLTFHETMTDAQTGANPLNSPYSNISPFSQFIYVRALDIVTGCYSIVPVELHVNPSPMSASLPTLSVCDADANTQNGITNLDLTQQTPIILALQPLSGSNYTITYYNSLVAAESQAGSGQIIPAANYMGSDGESIWYRVTTNSTNCYAVGSFQLEVNIPLLLNTPGPLSVCDADANPNDQYVAFDLTVKNNEITQGVAGYTVTYYPTLFNAQAATNPIPNPSSYTNVNPAIQTIGVSVTSPAGCVSLTTLDIRVLPVPMPNTNPPALAPKCDETNGEMMANFDLTANAAYLVNGDPTLTLHFFYTMMDAVNMLNEIMTPTNALVGGNVWIRVENDRVDFQGNNCYVLVEQPLRVNPLPPINLVSDNTLNTIYVDGLNNVVQPLNLDAQLYGNFTYTWQVDGAPIPDAISSVYVVNSASNTGVDRTFVVTATDLITGCTASNTIVVSQSTGTPSPLGFMAQSFNPGDTLAALTVVGSNILWYAAASNKNGNSVFSTPLPLNTPLVSGTTYYASQTIGGIESIARLPVTVSVLLGVPDTDVVSLQYGPNPVKNSLTLQSTKVLKSIVVYTMLGQKVLEQKCNDNGITLDLSNLNSGNYILKAQGDAGQKTIRVIKE